MKTVTINYEECNWCGNTEDDDFECPYCEEMLFASDFDNGKVECEHCWKKFYLKANISDY